MLPAAAGETKLVTVMLGVHDLDRATAFYAHTIGLTPKGRSGGHAMFDAGALMLILSTELWQNRELHGAMPVEFTFRVDALKPAIEHLLRAGVAFHGEPRALAAGDWHVAFDDPDGHRLSVLGPMTSDEATQIVQPSNVPMPPPL